MIGQRRAAFEFKEKIQVTTGYYSSEKDKALLLEETPTGVRD